jgi:hypothetical protein
MKTLFGKHILNKMALCVCFLSALPIAQAAEPIAIPMTADHWQTKENAELAGSTALSSNLEGRRAS